MSLLQQTAKWSLRTLLLWGAFELGSTIHATGAAHWTALAQLTGHRQAVARLEERARATEAEAVRIEAELARMAGGALQVTLLPNETAPAAAARVLREELIQLGAEAPVVDSNEAAAAPGSLRVTLTARWREPLETSPQVIHGLAQRFPNMMVERLELVRGDSVTAEAVLSISVSPAPSEATRVAQRSGALP